MVKLLTLVFHETILNQEVPAAIKNFIVNVTALHLKQIWNNLASTLIEEKEFGMDSDNQEIGCGS